MWPFNMQSSAYGFFHLAYYFWAPSIYQYFIPSFTKIPLYGCPMFHLSFHQLMDTWFFSHSFDIVNNTAKSTYRSFVIHYFYLSWVDTRNGITESYGKLMFNFFFKETDRLFRGICTILHSHQQCVKVLVFPYFHQ